MSIPDSARWLELGELYINVSDEHEAQYMVYVERAGLTPGNLQRIRLCIADFEGEGQHVILRQEEEQR